MGQPNDRFLDRVVEVAQMGRRRCKYEYDRLQRGG